jgi:hypothetical protein
MDKVMLLYHFTSLFNLPPILKDGLKKGEVPLRPRHHLNAPNLTTNPEPLAQAWAEGSATNKRKVRLAVEIPLPDHHLQTWRDVCRKNGVKREWMQALDPCGQGDFWYLYFGKIPPAMIQRVEIMSGRGYRVCAGRELEALVASIEVERQKFEIVRARFTTLLTFKEGFKSSWLLDRDLP